MNTILTWITSIWGFIKNHPSILYIIVITALVLSLIRTCSKLDDAQDEIDALAQNEKALMGEISENQGHIYEMNMSLDMLRLFNDSISNKLLSAQEELNIKDKNIKYLQYMLSQYSRKDTLILTKYDTIFKDKDFYLDTIIGDEWLSVELSLRWPNTICTDVSAKSEKRVVVSSKKETVDPPKKFFLCRWFQKKHTVTIIDIIEDNPYITSQKNRFVYVDK